MREALLLCVIGLLLMASPSAAAEDPLLVCEDEDDVCCPGPGREWIFTPGPINSLKKCVDALGS